MAEASNEARLLSVSKVAFQELLQSFPEHHDGIIIGLLDSYGLAPDGSDRGGGGAVHGDDATAQMRLALKVLHSLPQL